MWQHKDFVKFLSIISMISFLATVIGFFISTGTAFLVAIVSFVFILIILFYTNKRYDDIKQLSQYLRQISSGHHSLDIRDNYEGELSILKSEIYKVTSILEEQRMLLQKDKVHLTNAISDISHQLKTPLTSMSMMTDLLQSDTLPTEKRAEFTKTIRTQLERIEWLVSSLLKLSKIDAGTAKFNRKRTFVKKLIEQTLKSVVVPLDIKEQEVLVEGDQETFAFIDMNWTSEALINILRNSIIHTNEKGKINITFSQNVLFTEIIINDNGTGIPNEDLPYIFQRFYRGKNASKDSVGIGLAMAYSIIKEQSGDIYVTSSSKEGTTFTIKFYHEKTS